MTAMFKPGDKVVCVNDSGQKIYLTDGKVYKVELSPDNNTVQIIKDDSGETSTFYAHRFRLADPPVRTFQVGDRVRVLGRPKIGGWRADCGKGDVGIVKYTNGKACGYDFNIAVRLDDSYREMSYPPDCLELVEAAKPGEQTPWEYHAQRALDTERELRDARARIAGLEKESASWKREYECSLTNENVWHSEHDKRDAEKAAALAKVTESETVIATLRSLRDALRDKLTAAEARIAELEKPRKVTVGWRVPGESDVIWPKSVARQVAGEGVKLIRVTRKVKP